VNDSMQPNRCEDERLAALLAAVQAEANPAVWARVRTRLTAAGAPAPARSVVGARLDAFLDWLTRPAAMAAAAAALVVALGAGWTVIGSLDTTTATTTTEEALVASDATNLMESLLEPNAAEAADPSIPGSENTGENTAPGDSGGRT